MFRTLLLAALLPRLVLAFGGEDPIRGRPFWHELLTRKGARATEAGWDAGGDVVQPDGELDPDEDEESAASSLAWVADFVDAYLYNVVWNAGGGIARLKAALFAHDDLVKVHFDDLSSSSQVDLAWNRYLAGTVAGLLWAAERDDVPAARHIVGVGLHASQDFYSHSNWVDHPDRRDLTWLEMPADQRSQLSLHTGIYELQEQFGFDHHGKLALDCSLMHQINDLLGLDTMDLLCSGLSPLSNTGLCQRWRECKQSPVPTHPDVVLGVPVPANVVYLQPPGIALDTSWLARINGRNRDVPEIAAGQDPAEVGATLFAAATRLAERHTTQWLAQLRSIMTNAGHKPFWDEVRSRRRQGDKVPPGLPILEDFLSSFAEDVHQFEQPNKLPSTFLSAGTYPPDPQGTDEGWFVRLELHTAANPFDAGTNADIDVELGGRTFRLDHGHADNRLLEFNDFERGDHTAYTVGPLPALPSQMTLFNRAPGIGDIIEAAWNDLKAIVESLIDDIGTFIKSLWGGNMDFIGPAKVDWSWTELDALADGPGVQFELFVDGDGEGVYSIFGRLTVVRTPSGTLKATVQLTHLHCHQESTIDQGSNEDEVVIFMLVNSPAADQLVSMRTGIIDPESEIDSGDTHSFEAPPITVDVPRHGGLIVPIQLWEHDDDTQSERENIQRGFERKYRGDTEGGRSAFLDAVGAAVLPDWRLAAVDAFAFRRSAVVQTTHLARGRKVNRWIEADESLTIPFDPTPVRRVAVPALTPAVTTTNVLASGSVNGVAVGPNGLFAVASTVPNTTGSGVLRQYGLHLEPGPTTPLTLAARSIAYDPTRNRLYTLGVNESVHAFDAKTFAHLGAAPVGAGCIDVAVDPASGLVFVSRWQVLRGDVFCFRADDLTQIDVFGGPGTFHGPQGLAVDPGISRVYVARTFRSGGPGAPMVAAVTALGLEGVLVEEFTVDLGDPAIQPVDVAVDAPAGLIFAACLGGGHVHPALAVIDRSTFAVRAMVPIHGPARAVASRPGTGLAYVVGENGLTVVDGAAGVALTKIKLGRQPFAVTVDPSTGVAYAGDRFEGTISRIEAITGLA